MAKYATVNGKWPEGTRDGRDLKPTAQEAAGACKRLYRLAMGRPFKGKVQITSGNRRTWIVAQGGRWVMTVNPDQRGGGWHELVHAISHRCAYWLYPKAKPHSPQHAFIERQMIEKVVTSGWLEGKLRREPKPEMPTDARAEKLARTEAAILRWERKERRAKNALKKLRAKQRRYSKVVADAAAPVI